MKQSYLNSEWVRVQPGDADDGTKPLLVAFGGISGGLGLPPFEFMKMCEGIDVDRVFVRDIQQSWYHLSDDNLAMPERVIEVLGSMLVPGRRSVFVGNSMGAYAAILFGAILGCDSILAFAPQTFIDPENRTKHGDCRWEEQLSRVHASDLAVIEYFDLRQFLLTKTISKTEQIRLFYATDHHLDRLHAEHIETVPGVVLQKFASGGHGLIKELRDNGLLQTIILDALSGTG
jgi:hypothetical protein